MITVTVSINGHPVITRSARNTGKTKKGKTIGKVTGDYILYEYEVDDHTKIWHNRETGAAELAIEMLKGVKQI